MSTSLDVMTESNFKDLIIQYNSSIYVDNPIDILDDLSQHYTIFYGNTSRLYNVVYKGILLINELSEKENMTILKLSKEKILNIMNQSDNSELIDKWESIMKSFENCNPKENLYFIITNLFYRY